MRRHKPFGFELLQKQALDSVLDGISEIMDDWACGDSEIERLFHAAMILRVDYGLCEYESVLSATDEAHASELRAMDRSRSCLIVQRQVEIENYRVDFIINAWTFGRVYGGKDGPVDGNPRWRRLIVECDGHDFHERTKEQASHDKSRDRYLTAQGFEIFRFTGSEIWCDPWGCADQVVDWAAKGFG
jgi:very-short-patch-repair endonuclease